MTRRGRDVDEAHTLTVTRAIEAPVERVWDAWNDPEQIARWWGPAGFHSSVNELDVREGGRFDVVMHGPDGTEYPNVYVFDRVRERRQLIYTNVGSERFDLAPFQSVFDMEGVGPTTTNVTLTARSSSEEDRWRHVEEFLALEGARQLLERLEEEVR